MENLERLQVMPQEHVNKYYNHNDGVAALQRLIIVSQRDSGQSKYFAGFLLGLYNGKRFKYDLTYFRSLNQILFEDCLLVLRMDWRPQMEVHEYFDNGGNLCEQLALQWDFIRATKK